MAHSPRRDTHRVGNCRASHIDASHEPRRVDRTRPSRTAVPSGVDAGGEALSRSSVGRPASPSQASPLGPLISSSAAVADHISTIVKARAVVAEESALVPCPRATPARPRAPRIMAIGPQPEAPHGERNIIEAVCLIAASLSQADLRRKARALCRSNDHVRCNNTSAARSTPGASEGVGWKIVDVILICLTSVPPPTCN